MSLVTAKISDPENVQVTGEITMSVGEWDKFREALRELGSTWPYFRILNGIASATHKAKNTYYESSEE